MRLFDLLFAFGLFAWVFGAGVFELLDFTVLFFDLPQAVLVLTPARKCMVFGYGIGCFDDFADGVIEQVDVGGKMNVGFYDKGVATPAQWVCVRPVFGVCGFKGDGWPNVWIFFTRRCPALTTSWLIWSNSSGVNSIRLSLMLCRE